MKHRYTVCPHCGCGCGLYLVDQDGAGGVSPSLNHPFNRGQLCARGWTCHQLAGAPARLGTPLIRQAGRLEPAAWDGALDTAARRLKAVREKHGPGAVGVLGSPRLTTEELFALRSFAADVLGTPHYDSGARLAAFPAAFPRPATVAGLAAADLILVVGAPLLDDNPVLGAKVLALCKPAADRPYVSPDITHALPAAPIPLAVIGSRASALGDAARPFIQPRPGSEPRLLVALLKSLVENHRQHSADQAFAALQTNLSKHSLSALLNGTGVSAAQLENVAAQLAAARNPVLIAGRDLLQTAGADAGCAALADIALLLADRLSVLAAATGANDYAALRVLSSPGGMTYLEMADALRRKKLKALVLAGEDPLRALPGGAGLEQAFAGAEFILAIDSFPGQAQRHAGVVLPLALPAEKSGRFSAMDGGEQAFAPATRPAGQSRPLNEILHALSGRFRAHLARTAAMPQAPAAGWDPLRSFTIPKQPPQMVLELGGVYPQLPGGESLVGNTYHLSREFTGNYVELNPEDIAALGVRSGWKVKVTTAAASVEAPVRANGAVPKGTAFMPVHFGGLALAPFPGATGLNRTELRGIPVTIGKI